MVFRNAHVTMWGLIAVFALGLYLLKYDVQAIAEQNQAHLRAIEAERLALQMLEAEWVYLNRPDRLAALAEEYLDLKPMTPMSVASWQEVPAKQGMPEEVRDGL